MNADSSQEACCATLLISASTCTVVFAIVVMPDLSPTCWWVLQIGAVYLEQGDVEAALSTYMEALEHSPDNPEILTTVGITFLRCAFTKDCC